MTRKPPTVSYASKRKRAPGWNRSSRALRDTEPLCRVCQSVGRIVPAVCADHIVPLARGGSDDPSNLQPLCAACHERKTARENTTQTRADGSGRVRVLIAPPGSCVRANTRAALLGGDAMIDLDTLMDCVVPSSIEGAARSSVLGFILAMRDNAIANACAGALPGTLHVLAASVEAAEHAAALAGVSVEWCTESIDSCRERLDNDRTLTTARRRLLVRLLNAYAAKREARSVNG